MTWRAIFVRPSELESYDRGSEVGAFAPLLGVACGGDCHRRASFWGGAVGGDADVVGPEACQELCRSLSHAAGGACVAWTLARSAGGNGSACELHGAPPPAPPAAAAAATHDPASRSSARSHLGRPPDRDGYTDDSSESGPAACDKTSWLAFPDGLAVSPGGHPGPGWLRQDTEEAAPVPTESDDGGECYAHGRAYGWASLGAAADAKVLRCFGPDGALRHGVLQGWWGGDAAAAAAGVGSGAGVSVTRPAQCQAKCAETDGCAWFTMLALETDAAGGDGGGGGALCLLHAAIGKHGATTMTPTTTTASLPGAVAGPREGCVDWLVPGRGGGLPMGDAALGRSALRQLSAPNIKRCSALDFAGRFVGRAEQNFKNPYR